MKSKQSLLVEEKILNPRPGSQVTTVTAIVIVSIS